jgi:endonuclease/exonuclease/phosphatase family metal-dependent hydrolase
MRRAGRKILLTLLLLSIGSWLVVRSWSDPVDFTPGKLRRPARGAGTLKVVTLNIAHGRGVGLNQLFTANSTLERNLEAIGDYLRWEAADLVVLQEIDRQCLWSGGVNQARALAKRAGYYYWWFGLNNDTGLPLTTRYGNALLSRHRVIAFRNVAFGDELVGAKGFFEARIALGEGRRVTLIGAHLHHASAREREHQAERMARRIAAIKEPLIVLGDLNVTPSYKERTLRLLRGEGRLSGWQLDRPGNLTFHAARPDRRIDYILVSRHLAFQSHLVRPVQLSDHRPVVAVLRDSETPTSQPAKEVLSDPSPPRPPGRPGSGGP